MCVYDTIIVDNKWTDLHELLWMYGKNKCSEETMLIRNVMYCLA